MRLSAYRYTHLFFNNKINDLQPNFLGITGMATDAELVHLIQNSHFLPIV